jgi:predicted CXXCH cytochrome family protein
MTRFGLILRIAAVVPFLAACTDERIVFRDRELFTEPPTAAANFVGYTDSVSRLTVCGNCHVGQQNEWEETHHAVAFATLTEAGAAGNTVCQGCHTVNERGNVTEGNVGFAGAAEARYHDVQCEACHGPGLAHVTNPDASQPLAPLRVDTMLTVGCGECHTGAHHPFVEEWRHSAHGRVQASAAGRAECQGCHTGEDALRTWGVNVDYAERDTVLVGSQAATAHLSITCGVCHDPHSSDIDKQLRFAIDVPSEEENLCMKCHHKRGTPDPTTFRGPHSPEGPVLLGYGGWWPPTMNFPLDTIVATHGSDRNPRLCAGCHVNSYQVEDALTGDFLFAATGHSFKATPCLDAEGVPDPEADCDLPQRDFRTCTEAGCHATQEQARNLFVLVENRIDLLATTLEGLLAQIPASEFSNTDGRYTSAEGSRFNAELARFAGSPIHNPILIEALLTASIQQVRAQYGLPMPPNVNLENQLQHLSRRTD